mgnify:FL=1
MYVFTLPAESWDELNIDKQVIRHLILKHRNFVDRFLTLENYYEGKHKILGDSSRKNKLVCNHAKDISDTASAYFIGNPVAYKSQADITDLLDKLEYAGADEADGDNGLDLSILGRAYEYIYTKKDETDLVIKNLSPANTFVVYDDTIEQNELFAVYYYAKKDDSDRVDTQYIATVVTENYKYILNIQDTDNVQPAYENPEPHFKGEVPIIEYLNNKMGIGDFELQIPLIDAYNALMSDRVTDKEQFIDAILAIYGTLLSDSDEYDEDGNKISDSAEKAQEELKKKKILELPDGTKAEYLTRTFDENGVEILKKAIEQDIHKFSHIPCMSDEAFGGNVSGVAMEFKLLGMENITKIKTRYYKKGLRKRLRIFANFYANKGINFDASGIVPTFTRALPKNLLEISQIVSNLWGKVGKKTLLAQIPFVDDPDEELKTVEKETEEDIKRQQEMFGLQKNDPPEEGSPDDSQQEEKKIDE